MATSVLQIIIQTLKKGNGNEETVLALKKVQSSWGEAVKVAGVATGIYFALDRTLGDSVRTFLNYANEVKNLKDISGESAESTSRLIQVTDDYMISTDQLAKAQKALAMQGMTLNVATLASLSDKYKELNTGSERQLFLTKEFGGRTGQAFAEIMMQGSQAILARNAAVQQGLILTQEDLDSARQMAFAQDDLNDSVTAIKDNIGKNLVPVLNAAYLGYLTIANFLKGSMHSSIGDLSAVWEQAQKDAYDQVQLNHDLNVSLQEQQDQTKEATKANQEYLSLTKALSQENQNYKQTIADIETKTADLNAQIELATKRYGANSSKVKELRGQVDELKKTERERMEDHRKASQAIVLDLITQKLAADGLDDSETEMLLGLQEQWGFVDADTAAAARRVLEVANNMDALDGKSIDVAINVALYGQGSGMITPRRARLKPGTSAEAIASGGQMGNGWVLVGDAPGGRLTQYSELISPTGYVFNAEETRALMAAGISAKPMSIGGIGWGDDPIGMPLTPEQQAYNTSWYASAGGSGGGGGGSKTTRRASTSARASSSASQAAIELRAASMGLSDQAAQAAAVGAQGNAISKQILQAIDALPERLAAKMAQGRI